MPELWDKDEILVTRNDVAGALAKWAVQQSPYIVPERLGEAVTEFVEQWPHEDYARLSASALHAEIYAIIERCPLVKAWNEPKLKGAINPDYDCAFVSRYDSIKPDYDFIDLHALTRNVAHEITLWSQVEAAQDRTRTPQENPNE